MMKHRDADELNEKSKEFTDSLRRQLGNRIIGPHQPLIGRIKNLWLKRILIKIEKEASATKIKEVLKERMGLFYAEKKNHSFLIVTDVDPS